MKTNFLISMEKVTAGSLILLFLVSFQGCRYYYRVQTVEKVSPQNIKTCDSLNKLLVLHQNKSAWQLSGYAVTDNMLSGTLSVLPGNCHQYKTTSLKRGNRYRKDDRIVVLNQVHLYLNDTIVPKFTTGDEVKIDFSAVHKAEIYVKDKGRTTVSWVVPTVLGTMGVAIVAAATTAAIVALTKSSCPLVYVKSDTSYTFSGEIFGGAIYSSLERHDWLPLPGFEPVQNRYELKITNGLPEIQYINQAELWIVSHPGQVKVLPDRKGVIHTIVKPELPAEAVSSGKANILPLISMKDRNSFQFDESPAVTGDSCAFNTLYLSFFIPAGADTGKLVVSAGNSMWGDYTFGELTRLFGSRYEEFVNWQGKRSPEKTLQWQKDQRYPLMVYLETSAGWQFVDNFDLIGPLGAREMVMPVGLSGALITGTTDGNRMVRIKLESGFRFWDLDYAAIDFSKDRICQVDRIQPASAITETGKDVTQLLSMNDKKYYIQEKIGEEGLIVYQDSPAIPGMKKSVFLHTKGYYTHVRNYPNPPDKIQLQTFLVPGRFSKFSFDNYTEFMNKKMVFVSDPRLP